MSPRDEFVATLRSQSAPPALEEIRRRIAARREDIARFGALEVSVFGSCARGEQRSGSDIDLLVALDSDHDYFDLGEIKSILEADFDVPVNPVLASAVKASSEIRRDLVRVF